MKQKVKQFLLAVCASGWLGSCADTVTYSYMGDNVIDLHYKARSREDSKAKCSHETDEQGRLIGVTCELDRD